MTSKWSKIASNCQKYEFKTILTSVFLLIVIAILYVRDNQLQASVKNQIQRLKESFKVRFVKSSAFYRKPWRILLPSVFNCNFWSIPETSRLVINHQLWIWPMQMASEYLRNSSRRLPIEEFLSWRIPYLNCDWKVNDLALNMSYSFVFCKAK